MATTFTRAEAGQPLKIAAEAWNASLDAAEAYARDGRRVFDSNVAGVRVGAQFQLVVTVRNDTGRQLQSAYGCWLDELETGRAYDHNRYEANQKPTYRAVFRTGVSTSRWGQLFGICLENIEPGESGRVCIEGDCSAYIIEVSAEASGTGGYAVPTVFPSHPSTPLSSDFKADQCVLIRCQSRGPAQILYALGDEDNAETSGDDALYMVRLSLTSDYVVRAWSQTDHVASTLTYPDLTADAYPDVLTQIAARGQRGTNWPDDAGVNLYEGFSKQWQITSSSTGPYIPTGENLIERSIIRLPCAGLYEVDLTAIGWICSHSAIAAPTSNMTFTGSETLNFATLVNRYAIQIVPVDETYAEITDTDYFRMAWPGTPSGVNPVLEVNYVGASSDGAEFVGWDLLRVNYNGNVGYLGSRQGFGSFSGRCLLHVRDAVRIGLRVRDLDADNYAASVIPAFQLYVQGTLSARLAPPELFLPIASTVIAATPGGAGTYTYTLASTGSTAPPSVTISSYAWRVWTPNDDTVEGAGASLSTTNWTAYGSGEYVARLIVLYSDGSKGTEEHRFTLPN
ncbi:MAG: hypothetical protein EKK55_03565 [Rhodocyclaceae bacterium]|nr:MAG: hypothetical protein EKK55_03565 [Rhodocyclaceae bacterium]